jgi:hypothetical protein
MEKELRFVFAARFGASKPDFIKLPCQQKKFGESSNYFPFLR